MKRLQEDTMSKMAVLGRGSMRNKQQVSHKVHASTQNKLKVSLILNAHLDYSYHYFFEFSHLFAFMTSAETNQATSQKTLS